MSDGGLFSGEPFRQFLVDSKPSNLICMDFAGDWQSLSKKVRGRPADPC